MKSLLRPSVKKTLHLVTLCMALSFATLSCQRDDLLVSGSEEFDMAADGNGTVPTYTAAQWQAILADTRSEEALYKKVQLLTFAMTEFLGRNTSIQGNGPLAAIAPCDVGLGDPTGGFFRFLADQSGLTVEQVALQLSAYIETRISNCSTLPLTDRQQLCPSLLASLTYKGQRMDMRVRKPTTITGNNQNEIYLSYGAYSGRSGWKAPGFRHQTQSHVTSFHPQRPYAQGAAVNMLLFEVVPVGGGGGPLYLNDPCHYVGNPGGGGGNGGGGNLTDDGSNKTTGPLTNPKDAATCGNGTGLRIREFHLADRNEGGLFAGKSEVTLSATLYHHTAPDSTHETNELGLTRSFSINGIPIQYREGMLMAEVEPANISPTVNHIITPSGDDGVIIPTGFCDEWNQSGYGFDRAVITVFEFDPTAYDPREFGPILGLQGIIRGDHHWLKMTLVSDAWFTNVNGQVVTYNNLISNGGFLYLVEIPGGFTIQNTQPGPDRSWFLLELF